MIKSTVNQWGEVVTKWRSNVHPDNSKFMQVVQYMHVQKDEKNSLYWSIANSSANDKHVIRGIQLSDALHKFPNIDLA